MDALDPLAAVFFTKAQSGILGLLYAHPDESFYLREIAQRTGLSLGHVQRELSRLAGAGILRQTAVGRHVFFQANAECPLFAELRSVITKTIGAAPLLREALQPLAPRITVAFIFGSIARGTENRASDIDLMVIGNVSLWETCDTLRSVTSSIQRQVNPTVYAPDEFAAKFSSGHHFIRAVVHDQKLFMIGDEYELRSLLGQQMDQAASAVPGRNP